MSSPVSTELSPALLLVRCLVERKGGQWQAFSVDFGLAAQGDTEDEAKRKLEAMIVSFVEEALIGQDRAHAHELLARKATWQVFAKYYSYVISSCFTKVFGYSRDRSVYRQPMPLVPKHCVA